MPARDLELLFSFMDVKADPATMIKHKTTGDELLVCEDELEIVTATGLFTSSFSTTFGHLVLLNLQALRR